MPIIIPQDGEGTGGGGGGPGTDDQTATEVPYSNTSSGLTGTNCQVAIDELADLSLIQSVPVVGNYTMLKLDDIVLVNNTAVVTIKLPASPTSYKLYRVKDANGNALTFNIIVDGNGSTIDGISTFTMMSNYQSMSFVYNGSTWSIV